MKYTKPLAAVCITVALLFAAGCILTVTSYTQKTYDIDIAKEHDWQVIDSMMSNMGASYRESQNNFDSEGKLITSAAVSADSIKEIIKDFNEYAAEQAKLYGSKVKAKTVNSTAKEIAKDAYKGKTKKEIKADLKAKYPLK